MDEAVLVVVVKMTMKTLVTTTMERSSRTFLIKAQRPPPLPCLGF